MQRRNGRKQQEQADIRCTVYPLNHKTYYGSYSAIKKVTVK